MSNIGNCAFISHQIAGCGSFQVVIKDLVQAPSLSLVTVHTILNVLGRVSSEMIRLTLHRPNSSIKKEKLEEAFG